MNTEATYSGGALKRPERRVVGRKPARRHRGQRVVERIEPRHAQRHVAQRAGQRQADIDDRDLAGDLGGARQHLAHGVEGLGPEDLHPAHPQFGQEHHGHDDDADAAEPLQHARHSNNPSGRSSRPVNTVDPVVVMPDIASKRHRHGRRSRRTGTGSPRTAAAPSRRRRPAGRSAGSLSRPLPSHWRRPNARSSRADRTVKTALREDRPVPVGIVQVQPHRDQHRHAQHGDEQANDISDGAQIDHGANACRTRCAVKPRRAPCGLVGPASADVEQGREQPRVEAFGREGRALGQDRHGVMAVQAFLMAGHHAEIADARVGLQLSANSARHPRRRSGWRRSVRRRPARPRA